MALGWNHTVREADSLIALYQRLGDMPQPFTASIKPGEKRGISQNGLFHAWMGQIAKHTHDDDASVKADCHIQWGIPLFRGADADYAAFIESALGGLHRGAVKDRIIRGFIPCTSLMSKPLLSRYMDHVWQEYAPHVALMDPAALKWRESA
jgi:hypothetical protein